MTDIVGGLTRVGEYYTKLDHFKATLQAQMVSAEGDVVQSEKGRKFDKVYVQTPNQKLGRYMVDRNSWEIYGIKSWAQVNPRRMFGTLDTVDDFDWSGYVGKPKAGTEAAIQYEKREADIQQTYAPRGRPKKV